MEMAAWLRNGLPTKFIIIINIPERLHGSGTGFVHRVKILACWYVIDSADCATHC